jgi:hypothetical protein
MGTFDWLDCGGHFYSSYDGDLLNDDENAVKDSYLQYCVENIVEDFGNRIRVLESERSPLVGNEVLVAFRVAFSVDRENDDCDYDFHFRLFNPKTKEWTEKNGGGDIIYSNGSLYEPWTTRDFFYNSRIYFFAVKRRVNRHTTLSHDLRGNLPRPPYIIGRYSRLVTSSKILKYKTKIIGGRDPPKGTIRCV